MENVFKSALFKEKTKTIKGKLYLPFWTQFWVVSAIFYFRNTKYVLGDAANRPAWAWVLYFGVIAFMVFCIIFCYHRWFTKPIDLEDKGKRKVYKMKPWNFIVLAILCVHGFLAMELINNADMLGEMKALYIFMNIAGAMIMTIIFLNFVNSFKMAAMFIICFASVMALIFYYIYLCRGEPFQFIDLFSFGTAMEVAGGYPFEMTRWNTVFTMSTLCLVGFNCHWNDYALAFEFKKKLTLRIGTIAFMVVAYFAYVNINWNGEAGIVTNLWKPKKTYQEVGTNVGFFCVAKFMKTSPPEGYSVEKTEEIAEESTEEFEDWTGDTSSSTDVQPVNIIAIMNESWGDYSYAGDLKTNEDPMPFFHSLTKNTIKGHTMVCISGGGTAKSEYEFLTGNSVKQYPGRVPYVSWYTHDQYSLVSTLKSQGYAAVAMHPNKGNNWNRTNAYEKLGFEKFYTIDDFDSSYERVRDYISDKANYQKIIETVENKSSADEKLFLFDVTMQNHGGYTTDNFDTDIQVEGYNDDAVNRFLSLEKESDEALEYLINYFDNCDQPTMIVMFGDHYPSLNEGFEKYLAGDTKDNLSLEDSQKFYSTPFFIWTNYDMESQDDVLTSTNYLGTLMMKQTNLELTDFEDYQLMLMEDIQAMNHQGYVNSDGEMVSWDDATADVKKEELEYEYLQYNALVESSKRIDWFFTLGEDEK